MPEYVIQPGHARNPLLKHRNVPCPCGSNQKAKRCCGRFPVVPENVAASVKAYLDHLETHGFIEPKARAEG
jgi:hypothetical protein